MQRRGRGRHRAGRRHDAENAANHARISKWAMQAQAAVEARPAQALSLILKTMALAGKELGWLERG